MRIDRLDLVAYGPFTDQQLDLSSPGLHLVLGANEAGKSSTLAAITDALFGIPLRTTAGFVHHMTRLEIGMVLRDQSGATLAFRRVKKAKDTLRAADGSVIPDDALEHFLGGMDRAAFTTMFGITHDQLVAGGRDLVAGHGELGELLFGASTGSGNLHRTLKQLEDRSALLFKAGGHNPRVNAGISRYKSAAAAARDSALRPRAHDQVVRQIRQLEASLQATRRQEAAVSAERALVQLLVAVLPNLAARRSLRRTLDELRPVTRPLPPGIGDDVAALRDALERDRQQAQRAHLEVARLRHETKPAVVDERVLASAVDIGRLREQRGQHDQARRDRPAVAAQAAAAQQRAAALVAQLRPGTPPDQVRPSLRLPADIVTRLSELAATATPIALEVRASTHALAQAEQQRTAAQRALDAAPPPKDGRVLVAAVDACRADGDLVGRREGSAAALAELEARAAQLVARLPRGRPAPDAAAPGFEEVAGYAVPTLAVLQHHQDLQDAISRDRAAREEALQARRHTRDERRAELDQLVHDQHVPVAADLAQRRSSRDEQWARLVHLLQRDAPVTDAHRALVAELEQSISAADAVADRLRTDADQVARRAELERQLEADEQAVQALEEALDEDRDRQQRAEAAWAAQWAGVPVAVATPREMRPWVEIHGQLVADARRCVEQRRELAALDEVIVRHRDALTSALGMLGVDLPAGAWLPTVLAVAGRTIDELEQGSAARAALVAELARRVAARADAQQAHAEAERAQHEWDEAWAGVLRALDLAPGTTPGEATAFVRDAERALEHLDAADAAAQRLQVLDGFVEGFEADLAAVAGSAAPDLAAAGAHDVLGALIDRLAAAQAAQERALVLQAEQAEHQRDAEDAGQRVEQATVALAQLLEEVGATDDAELAELVARSEQLHVAQLELERVEQELRRQSGGRDGAALEAERAGRDEAALGAQAQVLDAQLADLRVALDRDGVELGHLQEQRAAMDGSAAAADAAEAAQLALAEVARDTEEYLAVHLASLLLRDAVSRYRERHQAPLLDRARPWFARLTAGSFVTLDTDLDAKGQTVLEAVRPDGERVPVRALSEGTRDQLFLALRLAAVALAATQAEPMPLILDDLFVNFDESRTRAALEIFGELSEQMQVVLFTHHQHVAELAALALPPHRLHLHRLRPRSPGEGEPGAQSGGEHAAAPVRLRPVS